MADERFHSELRRMARANGLHIPNENSIVRALEPADGEQFFNIFGAGSTRRRDLLVVTSTATSQLYRGVFVTKTRWKISHDDVEDVRPHRGTSGRYVIDSVAIEASGDLREFRMGFNDSDYGSETMREIAADNARIAAEEIARAVATSRSAPGPEPSGRAQGMNYFSR